MSGISGASRLVELRERACRHRAHLANGPVTNDHAWVSAPELQFGYGRED